MYRIRKSHPPTLAHRSIKQSPAEAEVKVQSGAGKNKPRIASTFLTPCQNPALDLGLRATRDGEYPPGTAVVRRISKRMPPHIARLEKYISGSFLNW